MGSLILYLISAGVGYNILNKIGFKKGIIDGFLLSVVGAICMIPSVDSDVYTLIMASFFIIVLVFSLQQTAANPFAFALGDPATSTRLSLAAGVNSLRIIVDPSSWQHIDKPHFPTARPKRLSLLPTPH